MTNNEKYFLIVAEELNIGRAAKRLFISQQCLSNHIKRLEQNYGVQLFNRKPKLSLTPAGETLVRALQHMRILENGLESELREIESGAKGCLRIGIHTTRAKVILPLVLPRFRALHPDVEISIFSGTPSEIEQMMLKGELDLFIAFYPIAASTIHTITLMEEKVYFAISDNLLKKYFPDIYPECKEKFKNGISVLDFKDIPLIMNYSPSSFNHAIKDFIINHGVKPNIMIQTNSLEQHLEFSFCDHGACFCPGMMVRFSDKMSPVDNYLKYLNVFPILNYHQTNRMVLAHNKDAYLPKYVRSFIDIVTDLFAENEEK